ncbi:MAG: hypothetical protein IJA11_02855 [Oscillospiraceae bacterium]|nr:hypothetical protein [Oscillospiraceae bacterium]
MESTPFQPERGAFLCEKDERNREEGGGEQAEKQKKNFFQKPIDFIAFMR